MPNKAKDPWGPTATRLPLCIQLALFHLFGSAHTGGDTCQCVLCEEHD